MEVKWLGHSCFKISHKGHSVVFDPFAPGSIPGLQDIHETADMVVCSHEHFDHNYREAVEVSSGKTEGLPDVLALSVDHDDKNGTLRGWSDILIMNMDGFKIAHFGDLGCELTERQKKKLRNLDLALVPVGGYYTIDGVQAAALVKELKPAVTIPMHYSSDSFGFDEIGYVDTFTELFDRDMVHHINCNTMTIEKGMAQQIAVLTYGKERD